ncbi:hypothetical protein THAOC_32226 [Thalassiosira oceanica]|uniref:Peptidase S54 rhomboid domain-containing protein n=1 Tax=Thalassiosira oceanica TaxID=159749 RepID=K0RQF1_THAOC|nr:hypothetical protein THAOC_32226 [Thalassiosira oceanica]|eukprot:EJK48937.1 hypothetical protein THAOC_32226 [Thalassiosira oceanica]
MAMISPMTAPAAKLGTLLVLLPFAITYLHLHYNAFVRNGMICFVGPHSEYSPPTTTLLAAVDEGLVSSTPRTNEDASLFGAYSTSRHDKQIFIHRYSPSSGDSSWGWPSVSQSATMLDKSISRQKNASNSRIYFDQNRWCIRKVNSSSLSSSPSTVASWCSAPVAFEKTKIPTRHSNSFWFDGVNHEYDDQGVWFDAFHTGYAGYPPSGIYQSEAAGLSPPLQVSCPSSAPRYPLVQNQNLQYVIDHPATCVIILVNVALAFHYWNRRVDPSSVSKQYARIVHEHEWWRGITGATAHFDLLHVGFNMVSMDNLGREIEGTLLNSIEFLMWNFALVVYTTIIMIAMVYARIRYLQRKIDACGNAEIRATYEMKQDKLRSTSSVGYSAVLFAWMVVSTMERKMPTCPIPFAKDVCFATYEVPGLSWLRFNWSPIVSLIFCQIIFPRVSFIGHLAGIICGFLLHWGLLPPLELSSVNVLIGGRNKQYVAVEGDDESQQSIKQRRKLRDLREVGRKQWTLLTIRNVMAFQFVISFYFYGWSSSMVLSQCVLLAYFVFAVCSTQFVWAYTLCGIDDDILDHEKVRSGMIWRGYFMSAVISIIVDSMSVASWVCLPLLVETFQDPSRRIGLLPVCIFTLVLRIGVNLMGLVVASKILHGTVQVGGGIFTALFSPILTSSRLIGDAMLTTTKMPLWTAFEGKGTRLGTRAESDQSERVWL